MNDQELLELLKKWNPWDKELKTGIQRPHYINTLLPYIERKEILVLKGVRRCGKSTIMNQLMEQLIRIGIKKTQILYLNLEDYRFLGELNIKLLEQVLQVYKQDINHHEKTFFFIDEAQAIPNWESWIRTAYDQDDNIKFIVSGSNASLLSKELSTLLTGRNLAFLILPLSFKEFKDFCGGKIEDYLEYGGFPEVVLEKDTNKKEKILQQYFEDIINRDILSRHEVRNVKQLTELAKSLISSSGTKTSLNKLSKVFGLSKDTITDYIGHMIDAFLLFEVNYFSFSARTRHDVTKLPKFYAIDTGIINAVNERQTKNIGRLYEHAVLLKLLEEKQEISYWSELHSEVDFIIGETAINVTATDKIPEREHKGLNEFKSKNKQFKTLLITKSTTKENLISLQEFLEKNIEP